VPKESVPEKLGRYTIVRELGKGAMGVVYEGLDPNINRRVAIKTARRDVMEVTGRADEMMERFLREATAAGGLNHPNIITIYDAAEEGDIAYIAMEYLEGGDLFDLMERKRRFTPEEAVDIAATVCEALAAAHDQGIVHRDVKPGNILMPEDGPLKVADFGVARIEDSSLTQEGAMIGTPHYMSPEQFMGQRADARSDLFCAGIILYEMLTGEKPFGGEALSTVMHNVIKGAPIEPQELNFAVNDTLSRVVLKALAKRPQDRYQSGRAMAAALREALKENPDPAITMVPGRAGGDAEATVLAQPADAEATVVTTEPPDRTASVAVPPRAAEPGAVAAAPPTRPKLLLPALIGTGIVIILVLIVAIVSLTGGKEDRLAPGVGGTTPAEPTIPEEAYFEEAVVTIVFAETRRADELVRERIRDASIKGKPLEFGGIEGLKLGKATVDLKDRKSGKEKSNIKVTLPGESVALGKAWTEFEATAKADGYMGAGSVFPADEPGETAEVVLVMLSRDAPL